MIIVFTKIWNFLSGHRKGPRPMAGTLLFPFLLLNRLQKYTKPEFTSLSKKHQAIVFTMCLHTPVLCITSGTQTLLSPVSQLYRWTVPGLYAFCLCTLVLSSNWTALIQICLIQRLKLMPQIESKLLLSITPLHPLRPSHTDQSEHIFQTACLKQGLICDYQLHPLRPSLTDQSQLRF